jgi:hypothetical protein
MAFPLIEDNTFYCPNKDTYPPFKNGLYLEEYFFNHLKNNNITHDASGRRYIPALWTNFQIESWFNIRKPVMQQSLNKFIKNHPCDAGYFTIVQYDDGPLLVLPSNTIVYGACSGTVPMPLIYQDIENKLENIKNNNESATNNNNINNNNKNILCSFVGTNTHRTRSVVIDKMTRDQKFVVHRTGGWSPVVDKNKQDDFITTTLKSKFALAPRGYGRSSFRFFEIMLLGVIPVYVWDDIEWLPYKDVIDYNKFCISINISEFDSLSTKLSNITDEQYKEMQNEMEKHKKYFTLDYMCEYVLGK